MLGMILFLNALMMQTAVQTVSIATPVITTPIV